MSPIYESEEITRDKLEEIRKRNVCSVCGGWLNMFLDVESGKAFVACNEWLRSQHQGVEREASRYEKGGLSELNIPTIKEIILQEHGEGKTKALDKYIGVGIITKSIATEIVNTLWGGAPDIEKTKCILLCQTYQLNPLMKHLYLVGYKRYKNSKVVTDSQGKPVIDWSIQQGIGATRLLAHRKHNYTYLDFTPRKATKEEVAKILGDTADPNQIYGFTHIKDLDTGAEAFGLRGIDRNANVKGMDKGNTPLNHACIRSERQALDRQYPGEMPQGIDVVDERYMDMENGRQVHTGTGEIFEGEAVEIEPETPTETHFCQEHGVAYELKTGRYGSFYAHKVEDGWCNEKKKKEKAAKAEATPEPELVPEPKQVLPSLEAPQPEKPKRDPDTIITFNELYQACHAAFHLQPREVLKELGVNAETDITDLPADCYRQIAAVR